MSFLQKKEKNQVEPATLENTSVHNVEPKLPLAEPVKLTDLFIMMENYKFRFLSCYLLMIPVLVLSPSIQSLLKINIRFAGDQYILLILATFIFVYGSWPFFKGVVEEFSKRILGVNLLISLALVTMYIFNLLAQFNVFTHTRFAELVILILILNFIKWIELRMRLKVGKKVQELNEVQFKLAERLNEDGSTTRVKVKKLKVQDRLIIRVGERIPADGIIIKGHSIVDESLFKDDDISRKVDLNDNVLAGSLNTTNDIVIVVTQLQEQTYLAQIRSSLNRLQAADSPALRLASRLNNYLVIIALVAAIITFGIWLYLQKGVFFAMERAVSVLIISLPQALILTTLALMTVYSIYLFKKGIVIKNHTAIEDLRFINATIFNKSGFLTDEKYTVTNLKTADRYDEDEVIFDAATLGANTDLPITNALIEKAMAMDLDIDLATLEVLNVHNETFIEGIVDGSKIIVVHAKHIKELDIPYNKEAYNNWVAEGKQVFFILVNDVFTGMIALLDGVKEDAIEAVKELKDYSIKTLLFNDDDVKVGDYLGKKVGVDEIYTLTNEQDVVDNIQYLQTEQQHEVLLLEKSSEDAAARSEANISIVVDKNHKTAIKDADIILNDDEPNAIVELLNLSLFTAKRRKILYWWIILYHLIAIPLAAGVLYKFNFFFNPVVAALILFANLMLLLLVSRRFNFQK